MKLFLGLASAALCMVVGGCNSSSANSTTATTGTGKAPSGDLGPHLKQLGIEDVTVGKGPTAEVGDTVYMEYTGKFANGVQFQSTMATNPDNPDQAPFSFQLSTEPQGVIPGWNTGIVGMKVGGVRKLAIPAALGYSNIGKEPSIPPNADLYFDVKLDGILKKGAEMNLGEADVKVGTGAAVKPGDWVTVDYKATLLNGFNVDSSANHTYELQFQVGTGLASDGEHKVPYKGVIAGVEGMKSGGERVLTCPPALVMNNTGMPVKDIPGDSVVKFDLKLLRVSATKEPEIPVKK